MSATVAVETLRKAFSLPRVDRGAGSTGPVRAGSTDPATSPSAPDQFLRSTDSGRLDVLSGICWERDRPYLTRAIFLSDSKR